MSGLKGSIGLAAESTYGTYVAPTRHHEFKSEGLKKVKNTVQGGGIAAGRLAQLGVRRRVPTFAGEGPITLEVPTHKFGLLLAHALGSSGAPVQQGATTAYLQTHTLGDNTGKYLTVQKGAPDASGTVRPYSFLGGKVRSIEFTCGNSGDDQILQATAEFDFQDVTEAQSLAAPSYVSGATVYDFGQMSVKLGAAGAATGSEASVSSVTKMSLKLERGMAQDRYYAGAAGKKAEPISSDWVKVSGTIDADYVDKTLFADRFAADSYSALIWEFTGANIAGANNYLIRFKVPMIFLDGDSPMVGGPDILRTSYPFVAQLDGTNPLMTVEYQSTDTSL